MIHVKIAKGKTSRGPARFLPSLCLSVLTLALATGAVKASAQDQAPPDSQITTLHVEANLIEIPVLVLTAEREKLPYPIAANKFTISLGGGPRVHPKYVRREGEDPIDLTIVIDPRGPQHRLLPQMSQSLAELAPSSLSPRDHVSIYVMGCTAVHVEEDVPADPKRLRSAMESALSTLANEKATRRTKRRTERSPADPTPNFGMFSLLSPAQ
jgi:hypothetical protein